MRKHSAHGMTPKEARKPENYVKVKSNLENNRVKNRKYEDIKVGDKVRIYKKKNNLQTIRCVNMEQKIDMTVK
jgi:uncharacterized membrane protein (UPF0127 family)